MSKYRISLAIYFELEAATEQEADEKAQQAADIIEATYKPFNASFAVQVDQVD